MSACTSYKADVKTICDSSSASKPDRAKIDAEARDGYFLEWSAHNVYTTEGNGLVRELEDPAKPLSQKAARLREAAKGAGIEECLLASLWEKQGVLPTTVGAPPASR